MITKQLDQVQRTGADFYETPSTVIKWVIPELNKDFIYYDPCVGRGQIPKILNAHGIDTIGTDLRENTHNNIYGTGGIDFLNSDYVDYSMIDGFIMNPPFLLSVEFVNKCLELSKLHNKNFDIWVFEKLSFWASKRRKELMNNNCSSINVCSRRPSMYKADEFTSVDEEYIEKPMGGTVDFAWFKFNLQPETRTFKSLG